MTQNVTCPICNTAMHFLYSVKDYDYSNENYDLLQCPSCHFSSTQNPPNEEKIGEYYNFQHYISHTNQSEQWIAKVYKAIRTLMLKRKYSLIKKHLPKVMLRKSILDIGTGIGYFLEYMQRHGWNCTGIEPSEKARQFIEEKFNINIYPSAKLQELPSESFDVITLWHSLEHIYNMSETIEKTRELLTKNGLLVIALPNYLSYDGKHYQSLWAGFDVPRHLWHFSPKSLTLLLQKNDFTVIKKYRMPFDSFYVSFLSSKHGRKNIITAFFVGLYSYWLSLFNTEKCSSIIYVCQKSFCHSTKK